MTSPDQRDVGSADQQPVAVQRVAAYVLCVREGSVLLTRTSAIAAHPDRWTLPGGGVDHGEHPRDAARRETWEETGLDVVVGDLLDVLSVHFTGVAPTGRVEDYHAVGLVFRATTADAAVPRVVEVDGTTAHAAWVSLAEIASGAVDLGDVTERVLDWAGGPPTPRG